MWNIAEPFLNDFEAETGGCKASIKDSKLRLMMELVMVAMLLASVALLIWSL